MEKDFLSRPAGTRDSGIKLKDGRFRLHIRKKFFTMMVLKMFQSLEQVALSLAVLKAGLNGALSNLAEGVGTGRSLGSLLTQIILQVCDTFMSTCGEQRWAENGAEVVSVITLRRGTWSNQCNYTVSLPQEAAQRYHGPICLGVALCQKLSSILLQCSSLESLKKLHSF